ncbi:MAG: ThuA domain-containing protein [Gemmatimonadetes bacterium]|nr:ThuA domain-containing protein [Gemmatimonadota bacterium]MBT5146072.1 ThuA domain-containing protein [Gemmatimonadota bacterium]MBT5591849.1 ThuA domain-containing protein [Gemmatimonadota bacterium]MBT5961524.1 ThuA domain-containing protein [Gemmatimonadota bacterium]MBT7453788.1 ThuA domain-containing protein [Gemmatimonadota bacterium]
MTVQPRAFALVGDRYHNADYIRTALGKSLVRDLGLHIDFSDEVTRLSADTMASYELLIIFRDGMLWPDGYGLKAHYPGCDAETEPVSVPPVPAMTPRTVPWITPEQGRAVRAFVDEGGAALFYHNTTYISPDNEDFRHVQGSVTQGHPAVRPYRVEITNKDHPITRDVSDFVVTDEQHFMVYDKDPGHVLAESVNDDGHTFKDLGTRCQAAWAYDYGKGRVAYLAPGHTVPALWNPEYEKLQRNAVRWLLRQT